MDNEQIMIETEYIKLDSLLKFAGFAETGGQAKELIERETVQVNGEPEKRRGRKIRPGDVVCAGKRCIEVCSK